MDHLNPPEHLQLQGNVADNWKRFKQAFEIYQAASGLEAKSRRIQSISLLHIIGPEAIDVYNTFQWPEDGCQGHLYSETNCHVVDCILNKLEQYCVPRKNVTIEIHIFFYQETRATENLSTFS